MKGSSIHSLFRLFVKNGDKKTKQKYFETLREKINAVAVNEQNNITALSNSFNEWKSEKRSSMEDNDTIILNSAVEICCERLLY